MSKKGPRVKRGAALMAVNPQAHKLPKEDANILLDKLIKTAKIWSPRLRKEQEAALISDYSSSQILEIDVPLSNIEYEKIVNSLVDVENSLKTLQRSENSKDGDKIAALMNEVKIAQASSETAYLIGLHKCNLLYFKLTLLVPEQNNADRKTLINAIFKDLPILITLLGKRFLEVNLTQLDYDTYYQIIHEAIGRFIELRPEYQTFLIEETKKQLALGTFDKNTFMESLGNLLLADATAKGLWLYLNDHEKIKPLKENFDNLINMTLPLAAQIDSIPADDADIPRLKELFEKAEGRFEWEKEIVLEAQRNPWLGMLEVILNYYHRNDIQSSKSKKEALDPDTLRLQAAAFNAKMEEFSKDRQFRLKDKKLSLKDRELQAIIDNTKVVLDFLEKYRSLEKSQLSQQLSNTLFTLTLSLLKLLRQERDLNKSYAIYIIHDIIKNCATQLQHELSTYQSLNEKKKPQSNVTSQAPTVSSSHLSEVVNILNHLDSTTAIYNELVKTSKTFSPLARKKPEIPEALQYKYQSENMLAVLVARLRYYLIPHQSEFNETLLRLKDNQKRLIALSQSDGSGPKEVETLEQEVQQDTIASEKLILSAVQNCNLCIALLNFEKGSVTSRKIIINELFEGHLLPVIEFLPHRFINNELTELEYYTYYQLIHENVDRFMTLTEEYEAFLVEAFKAGLSTNVFNATQIDVRLKKLLNTYMFASHFCISINDKLKLGGLRKKYYEMVAKFTALLDQTTEKSAKDYVRQLKVTFTFAIESFESLKNIEAKVNNSPWLGMIKLILKYEDIGANHPDNETIDVEAFYIQSEAVCAKIDNLPINALDLQTITAIAQDVLDILRISRSLGKSKLSKRFSESFSKVTSGIMRLIENDTKRNESFPYSILREIISNYISEFNLAVTNDMVNEVSCQIATLTLDETNPADNEKPATMIEPSIPLKHEDKILATSTIEQDHQKLESDRKELAEQFNQRLKVDQAQFNVELAQKRNQDLQAMTEKIRQAHLQELSRQQKEMRQSLQKAEEEINKEVQKLQTAHQEQITTLNGDFCAKKELIRTQNDQKLQDIKSNHQISVNQLHKTQAEELKKLKNENKAKLKEFQAKQNREIALLKEQHAQKLNQLKAEQEKQEKHQEATLIQFKAQYQSEQDNLKSQYRAREQQSKNNLEKANRQHLEKMTEIKNYFEKRILEQENQSAVFSNQSIAQQLAFINTLDADTLKIIRASNPLYGLEPIRTLNIPSSIWYILKDLQEEKIQFFLVGEWVRNSLLRISTTNVVVKVMVNCLPEQLPSKILARQKQRRTVQLQEDVNLGELVLWCKPWNSLSKALKEDPFTIHSFVVKINNFGSGDVYDVLGYAAHIDSAYVHLIEDSPIQFSTDPSLMLSMLNICTWTGKSISPQDLMKMQTCSSQLAKLPLNVYLIQIQGLFLNSATLKHLNNVEQMGALSFIFPMISLANISKMIATRPQLYAFWLSRLDMLQSNPALSNSYYTFALFLLLPVLMNDKHNMGLDKKVVEAFDNFFARYPVPDIQKDFLIKSVSALLFPLAPNNTGGLLHEFFEFEDNRPRLPFTPYYNFSTATPQSHRPSPATPTSSAPQSPQYKAKLN